ncbi:MAG: hypothetical protein GF334_01470 [Candidatus Altiarchaeales archaeon]|nr:hypothetical protein [Candidatus Altiarchaeales archaeon]
MSENNQEEKSTLSFGQYTIELSNGPSMVYRINQEGHKEWIAACPEPETAMAVVEGMVLVENKRFYYPDSKPTINFENSNEPKQNKEVPKFLQRKRS